MIKAFDKSNLRDLRVEMESALAQVSKKFGIQIRVGNASFMPETATFKVELATKASDGTIMTKEAAAFKQSCDLYNLKPEHLFQTFVSRGITYKIVGLASGRSWKYPILCQSLADGKTYKFAEESIPFAAAKKSAPISNLTHGFSAVHGVCQNEHAFDAQFHPIGKCSRPATTRRKHGTETKGYCADCAKLIDEARAEMEAEARANR